LLLLAYKKMDKRAVVVILIMFISVLSFTKVRMVEFITLASIQHSIRVYGHEINKKLGGKDCGGGRMRTSTMIPRTNEKV